MIAICGVRTDCRRLIRLYFIEAMASVAATLLNAGIFFFTREAFGWGLRPNLLLSVCLGAVYVLGALSAHGLTRRFGSTGPLAFCLACSAAIMLLATLLITPAIICLAAIAFTFIITICWPILESLICAGHVPPEELSGRIGLYNIVWSLVGAATLAGCGTVIEHVRWGVLAIAAVVCAVGAAVAWFGQVEPELTNHPPHPPPECKLVQQRVLALYLARISLPAMYVITYALAAMMPSLAVLEPYRPAVQTLLSSVWTTVRSLGFLWLGATVFWHTKPRLLLIAAAAMLVSFIAITIPASKLPGLQLSARLDLWAMIIGQVVLGLATGLVYTASLYFGMALTAGSASSGGYHEAMIGLGMTLGPAAALTMQYFRPGDPKAATVAVAGLLGATIIVSAIASIVLGRGRNQQTARRLP